MKFIEASQLHDQHNGLKVDAAGCLGAELTFKLGQSIPVLHFCPLGAPVVSVAQSCSSLLCMRL